MNSRKPQRMAGQRAGGQQETITPTAVRSELVDALRLDLVGPDNDHAFARELLPESPTRWYLTGSLVPTDAPIAQRFDETSTEEIDSPAEPDGLDDAENPDRAAARRSLLPSSMGLSFLVPGTTEEVECVVMWGDYVYEDPKGGHEPVAGEEGEEGDADQTGGGKGGTDQGGEGGPPAKKGQRGWRRIPQTRRISVRLPAAGGRPGNVPVPESNGISLVATVRAADMEGLPEGTKAVSAFMLNGRRPNEEHPYQAFAFQAGLEVHCEEGFVPRPDPRGWGVEDEWDQRVGDLQYRDVYEYAVGHGVSADAVLSADASCHEVHTIWIPEAEVERVAPAPIPDVELGMEALGELADGDDARAKVGLLPQRYREWIDSQQARIADLAGNRGETAREMLEEARYAADRIEIGVELLVEPDVLEAFKIANRAVARAARQRIGRIEGKDPSEVKAPAWYPFQLAFILMNLQSIVDPTHVDRERVDLLFFPTGGGKTEAYLGLAAFALVLRRLKNPGIRSAGMGVLMRYTLRLLTLDQLGRAAALICALELEREKAPERLGDWPFEIALWVGQAATPNRMGRRGDRSSYREYTAYTKTARFMADERKPSPIPLENCPWCGTKFNRHSFRLLPNVNQPTDLRAHCANHECIFTGDRHLPIVAVDEPIYRRLPCFMIATVDKFAALPWTGETGTLFGKVDRYDADGFYGPCDPERGVPLPSGQLLPPDLIIQDELHLISGPLGTVAGLYETAIDALATREEEGRRIRPKIVASTATVRRAEPQIRALFERSSISVFPPPGPDRRDSFFARTVPADESSARLYVGVAAQGRSLKVVLLRAALALLSAGQTAWDGAGGLKNPVNPTDPYMTLLVLLCHVRQLRAKPVALAL